MNTQDFTRLPLGTLVSFSRTIIRCPRCRRHGVLESDRQLAAASTRDHGARGHGSQPDGPLRRAPETLTWRIRRAGWRSIQSAQQRRGQAERIKPGSPV
jgi:hypothetical protein